jgi:hypothetical protein
MNSIRMGRPLRTAWHASHGSSIRSHIVRRAEPAMGAAWSAGAAAAVTVASAALDPAAGGGRARVTTRTCVVPLASTDRTVSMIVGSSLPVSAMN